MGKLKEKKVSRGSSKVFSAFGKKHTTLSLFEVISYTSAHTVQTNFLPENTISPDTSRVFTLSLKKRSALVVVMLS